MADSIAPLRMNSGLSPEAQAALDANLSGQVARYPQMEVRDLYKLLHQGALGSEHAVTDLAGARDWLDCELRALAAEPAGPNDPLVDPLSPDHAIVRIHLRPYVAAGRDPEALLLAFARTAQEFRGSADTLRQCWVRARELAAAGRLPFLLKELNEFFLRMEGRGFPAVHHSQAYESAYRPAYRVIHRTFLDAASS